MSRVVCRVSDAGMRAYPRTRTAGGRKPPRHEIASGGSAWQCRGRYGDFAAGLGVYVRRSVGGVFGLAGMRARGWRFGRAAGAMKGAAKCLRVVVVHKVWVKTQAPAVSAKSRAR